MFGIIETPSVRSQPPLAVRACDVGSFQCLNTKTVNLVHVHVAYHSDTILSPVFFFFRCRCVAVVIADKARARRGDLV